MNVFTASSITNAAVRLVAILWLLDANAATGAEAMPFSASAIVERNGVPQLVVDGRPFYLNGAAFFYERLPRSLWQPSIERLRALGINTLDLYVPWNWHEVDDGRFDFTGRTNPRRDLRGLLRLIRRAGMRVVVRPGPVIRNEWRNGGYPSWLLARPEYGMPLHDLLEGRYPPTATLQNARSDDAAAQWLANATHLRYSARWLRHVADEFRPYADRVIAWQIDDDQGAYIDNQTWPAPHLVAYLERLRTIVREATSPLLPLYINTYEMKVTAAAPLWAMGNWYQSEAYTLGEHDRASLEFATGLLQTQPHQPLVMSEFQAGWLEAPGDALPRATNPANTTLALHTLLGMGMRGVIHFPAQDTIAPAGWEAPFANALYAWDAALQLDPRRTNPRVDAVAAFGELVRRYGPALARSRRAADAAIAWLPSAVDARTLTQDDIFALQSRTQTLQRFCRRADLACDLVDLRYADAATLHRYPMLLLPAAAFPAVRRHVLTPVLASLARYRASGGTIASDAPVPHVVTVALPVREDSTPLLDASAAQRLLATAHHRRVLSGAAGSLLVTDRGDAAFVDIVNYDAHAHRYTHVTARVGARSIVVPRFDVAPHSAAFFAIDPATLRIARYSEATHRVAAFHQSERTRGGLPLRAGFPFPVAFAPIDPNRAVAYRRDVFDDGDRAVVLQNDRVRAIVSPNAGARAFVFEDLATSQNVFTTVGAWRDDVAIAPPLSTTDRIGKYTRSFPAGFFNRGYDAAIVPDAADAVARFRYRAPDVVPAGAWIERTIRLRPHARALEVTTGAAFAAGPRAAEQRLVEISSLVAGDPRDPSSWIVLDPRPAPFRPGGPGRETVEPDGAIALYDRRTKTFVAVAWPPGDVERATLDERRDSLVVRLQFAPGRRRSAFVADTMPDLEAARAAVLRLREDERTGAEANSTTAGEVAKWYTQSPQKRPSVSSCGFESHLPQICAGE